MAVYRVDVLTEDPWPVFEWIEANVPGNLMVRRIAYKTVRGWYVKAVFKRQSDAELFHRRWHPEADDHTVAAFVKPT
jgi:hypothetical protein